MNLAQEGTKQVNEDVEFLVIGAGRRAENYVMFMFPPTLFLHQVFHELGLSPHLQLWRKFCLAGVTTCSEQ